MARTMRFSNDDARERPLGVFDSGIGGLTVVKALHRALPGEAILYLGDTARLPYGTKSAGTVTRYSRQTAEFLVKKGVKYLVVACNTASAHAVEILRSELPIPVMGVVEPGARAAASRSTGGRVGVIGTLSTVESGAYHSALHAVDPSLAIYGQPCPLLVPLTEEGWLEHPVTELVVRHYLTELRTSAGDLDTIVLGCTHYPLLKGVLAREAKEIFGHAVDFVDSAVAVSDAVAEDLRGRDLLRRRAALGEDVYYLTDVSRFAEVAARFLGNKLQAPELADL
jgi:glutamate racemase